MEMPDPRDRFSLNQRRSKLQNNLSTDSEDKMKTFWNDQTGFAFTTEMIVVLTLVIVGVIVAFTALREAIVTEMADAGASLSRLNQSYVINGLTGHSGSCAGSFFTDLDDYCDSRSPDGERCVVLSQPGVVVVEQ